MMRQRGAGMAELLVALAVGMLAMLLAAGLLVTANRAYVAQTEAATVDDGGRYALDIIGRAARQAAFVDWERDAAGADSAPASLAGLDARSLNRVSYAIASPRLDAVNGSDVLAVRFAGAGRGSDGDGSVVSCAGFGVGEQGEGWSIFYVARDAAGEAELRCKYHGKAGWGADAIVSGVDSFQVLYGVDTDEPPDGVANRYLNAEGVEALDRALVLNGENADARERDRLKRTYWKRISALRVALLLHGAHGLSKPTEPATFELFGDAYANRDDAGTRVRESDLPPALQRRERKLFTAAILLRNPAVAP